MKNNTLFKTSVFALAITLFLTGCSLFGGTSAQQGILREMQGKVQERDMKSGTVKGKVTFDVQTKEGNGTFSIAVDSDFDIATKGEEKMKINLDGAGEGKMGESTTKGNAQINIITLAKTLYLNLADISVTSDTQNELKSMIDLYANAYKGQWWKFDNAINTESTIEKSNLTADQEKQLTDLVKTSDFFIVKEDKGTEKINGKDAYHYIVDLDKEGIVTFTEKAAKIVGETMTDTEKKDMKDSLDKMKIQNMELWIGTTDKYLYQAKGTLSVTEQETTMMIGFEGSIETKDVSIEAPADAKDFDPTLLMPATPTEELNLNSNVNQEDILENLNVNISIPTQE